MNEQMNNEERESLLPTEVKEEHAVAADTETPLDKNIRLMSPMRMVLRRFFRSKLSVIGLIMIVSLFLFCWIGPLVYTGFTSDIDRSGTVTYTKVPVDLDGDKIADFYQVMVKDVAVNNYAEPSLEHPLGTDQMGWDNLSRLMKGGQVSLVISFLSVFIITLFGVVFGGIAGYFGGWVDNVIMRICDILMCLPGFPVLLIVGSIIKTKSANGVYLIDAQYHIYILMAFLTLISWSGTARLVRGQILSLREQEYMVAAEAMGYSSARRIFKHLLPNVMPQLIVSMTMSLGSMILYEASLSYLGIGATTEYAAWGTLIQDGVSSTLVFENYFNIWMPPGLCIIIAVLGFNFVGDGLRDALDPKMRR